MKTEYLVFRYGSNHKGYNGDQTLALVVDEERRPVRPFPSEEEAMAFIEHLLKREYGPFLVLPSYTK